MLSWCKIKWSTSTKVTIKELTQKQRDTNENVHRLGFKEVRIFHQLKICQWWMHLLTPTNASFSPTNLMVWEIMVINTLHIRIIIKEVFHSKRIANPLNILRLWWVKRKIKWIKILLAKKIFHPDKVEDGYKNLNKWNLCQFNCKQCLI